MTETRVFRRSRLRIVLLAATLAVACLAFFVSGAVRVLREHLLVGELCSDPGRVVALQERLDDPVVRGAVRRYAGTPEFSERLRGELMAIVLEATEGYDILTPWIYLRWGVVWAAGDRVYGYLQLADSTGVIPCWLEGSTRRLDLLKSDLAGILAGPTRTLDDGTRLRVEPLEDAARRRGFCVLYEGGLPRQVATPALRADGDSFFGGSDRTDFTSVPPFSAEFFAWSIERL